MQIETVGNYRLELLAHEMQGPSWDPFVTVLRFDEEAQDFVCELEKQRAGPPCSTYESAIEAARQAGTEFIRSAPERPGRPDARNAGTVMPERSTYL